LERRRIKSQLLSTEGHLLGEGSEPEAAGIANKLKVEEEEGSPLRRDAQLVGVTGKGKVFDEQMRMRG